MLRVCGAVDRESDLRIRLQTQGNQAHRQHVNSFHKGRFDLKKMSDECREKISSEKLRVRYIGQLCLHTIEY